MTRAALLLIVSIGLCSCGPKQGPVMVTVPVAQCPAPQRPALPDLDAALPLDSPANVERLMIRDDALRGYIHGLESCVECYRRQAE